MTRKIIIDTMCDLAVSCLSMKRPSLGECKKVAVRFNQLRKVLDLRQDELANLIGVRREEISAIENCRVYPSRRTLVKFSEIEGRQEALRKETAHV